MKRRGWRSMGLLLVAACGGDGASAEGTDTDDGTTDVATTADANGPVDLVGGVQKGPFVLGTTVTVSMLDNAGQPSGDVFPTQTLDDLGAFEVGLPEPGAVALEATGFYYNEVSGSLSTGPLTLRAYAVLEPGEVSTYLNGITHLVAGRVPQLVAQGQAPADAIAQAESELRTALGIGLADFDPEAAGGAMTMLGGDTAANAYLLGVSAVLAQVGVDDAGGLDGPVDAALQEFLNSATADLADDGALQPSLRAKIDAAELSLDPDAMMAALAQRLANTGSDAEVPDVNMVLDADDDGVVNAFDSCPKAANPRQEDADGDFYGDPCDVCPDIVDLGQLDADGDGKGDACDSDCGDELLGPDEVCDDGSNGDNSDDCTDVCTTPVCGDGIVWSDEFCDDGDALDGNGCNVDCVVSGTLLWEVAVDGGLDVLPDAIETDASGNAYVSTHGGGVGTVTAFDPDGSPLAFSSGGGQLCPDLALPANGDILIMYVDQFQFAQVRRHSGMNISNFAAPYVALRRLAVDSNNRYVGAGGNELGPQDFAVAVFDDTGAAFWSDVLDDPDEGPIGDALGVAVTGDDGVVAVGQLPDPGGTVGVVRRYDVDGNVLWTDVTAGGIARWSDVAIDANGEIFVAGQSSNGDGRLRRYTDDGAEQWTVDTVGGALSSVRVAPGGDVVVGGTRSDVTQWVVSRRSAEDGAELWTVTDPGGSGAFVSVAPSGTIYALGTVGIAATLRAYAP